MTIETNNFLSSTGFRITLDSTLYPGLTCSIQSFNLPSVSIGSGMYATPYRNIPFPGDKYEFSPLNITMILKEDLSNYVTIFNWLKQCVETADDPLSAKTSDIRLTLFNNKNISSKQIAFITAFPSSIGEVKFQTTDNADEYLTVDVTFEYAHFKID